MSNAGLQCNTYFRIPPLLVRVIVICSAFFVSACENNTSQVSMTLDSNAYFAAYQKGSAEEWRTVAFNNTRFGLKTVTFSIEDEAKPYSLIFVCPSSRGDKSHEIHLYYLTTREADLIDFKCRLASEEIIRKPVYGAVSGIILADANNSDGEIAEVALSKDASLSAHEAYAVIVASGQRDVVAYKGKQGSNDLDLVTPETFYIERGVALALTTNPQVVNVDFQSKKIGVHVSDFAINASSTVKIEGLSSSETMQANLGFLSEKKTYLKLKQSNVTEFEFSEVPLTLAEDILSPEENNFFLGEGHELVIKVFDEVGTQTKEYIELFTVSEQKNHTVRLPNAITPSPSITLKNSRDLQEISLDWKSYQTTEMSTVLYRWRIFGKTAAPLQDEKPDVEVSELTWIVSVTPGWLEKMSNTRGDYKLSLPTSVDINIKDSVGDSVYAWRKEWAFKASTPVEWELGAFAFRIEMDESGVAEDVRSNDLLEYIMNRNFEKTFSFSQAIFRDAVSPQL